MRESDETIVALSSPVMIAPFPQYRSLGRNTFKNGFFPSVRLASLLSLCMCLYCKSACECKACNAHCVRLDWQCLRVYELGSACVGVCACVRPTGDSVWAYWRTNCADTACQKRSACLHPALAAQSANSFFCFLPPVFLRLQLNVQPSCDSCWSYNIRPYEELGETLKSVKEEMFILHQLLGCLNLFLKNNRL